MTLTTNKANDSLVTTTLLLLAVIQQNSGDNDNKNNSAGNDNSAMLPFSAPPFQLRKEYGSIGSYLGDCYRWICLVGNELDKR